jgi:hypothetical protein
VVFALPHMGNWDQAGAWIIASGASSITAVIERVKPESVYDRFVADPPRRVTCTPGCLKAVNIRLTVLTCGFALTGGGRQPALRYLYSLIGPPGTC